MREWILGLAPAAVAIYFLFYPGQFAMLISMTTKFFR